MKIVRTKIDRFYRYSRQYCDSILSDDILRKYAQRLLEDEKGKLQATPETRRRVEAAATGSINAKFRADTFIQMMMEKFPEHPERHSATYLIGAAIERSLHPFVFEDQQLVTDIVQSSMSGVPVEALRFPSNCMLISIPGTSFLPLNPSHGGGQFEWDILFIYKGDKVDVTDGTPVGKSLVVVYCLTTIIKGMSQLSDSLQFMMVDVGLDPGVRFTETEILGADGSPLSSMAGAPAQHAMTAIKLALFISSYTGTHRVVTRSKKDCYKSGMKPGTYAPRYSVISMGQDKLVYGDEDDPESTGRTVKVRHHVIGHFKVFTKGKLAGRVIWCPPHWRGPELGPKNRQLHVVGDEEDSA